MSEISRFFVDSSGDRLYQAADFTDVFHLLFKRLEGVIYTLDNQLAVTSTGGLSVNVNTGAAVKAGYVYKNTASLALTLDAVAVGSKRIDRIVIRVDTLARTMAATVIKGTENASPVAPSINGTTDVLLAKILINNTSGYTYTVTDERVYRYIDADTVNAIAAPAFWYSSSGTGGSDGNGGQPPAPKCPSSQGTGIEKNSLAIGQMATQNVAAGVDPVAPSCGGAGMAIWTTYDTTNGSGYGASHYAFVGQNIGATIGNSRILWWRLS